MTDNRWEKVKAQIEEQFGVLDQGEETPNDGVGKAEWIMFTSPLGKVKLVRIVRPRLVGEKTQYSHRIGGAIKVNKVYDEDELVSFVRAYRYDEGASAWRAIEYPMGS